MLETLLGSRLRAKVLGWLFTHPDERYFVRQLTKILGEDSTNVSRELARLHQGGILTLTQEGKQKYYQANSRSPVYAELHGLMLKTAGMADIIRKALEPRRADIRLALIFGSLARKTEHRFSDIDLMVIGKISFGDVVSLITPAQKSLMREINPVVYSIGEFKQRVAEEHFFTSDVLAGENIFVVGDENELKSMVGKRLDKNA